MPPRPSRPSRHAWAADSRSTASSRHVPRERTRHAAMKTRVKTVRCQRKGDDKIKRVEDNCRWRTVVRRARSTVRK